ncbi:hypothetical protein ACHAPJ_008810 [Fusarium lateritium]
MLGPSTSDSRLSITLQGYDIVIALSQSNINESLGYQFGILHPELCDVKATVSDSGDSLEGTLEVPTIQLIDIDGDDKAMYCLKFQDGNLTQYTSCPGDDDAKGGSPNIDKVVTSAEGWEIIFRVGFSLKKMAQIPEMIRDKVQLPGSYSVEQLVVDLDTADMVDVATDRCVLTGFATQDAEDRARACLSTFVRKWISQLNETNNEAALNVLSYVVKADNHDSLPPSRPSFPPTSVRLQTINHRPEGDRNKSSPEDDFNAFLFTEMTGFRDMVTKDLAWSGDWFYEGIGGTMAMSKRVFWDEFLSNELKVMNEKAIKGAQNIVQIMAATVFNNEIDFSHINTNWQPAYGVGSIFVSEMKGEKYLHDRVNFVGPNPAYEFSYKGIVKCSAIPVIGQPVVELCTVMDITGHFSAYIYGMPKAIFEAVIDSRALAVIKTKIRFHQVADTGRMVVSIQRDSLETPCEVNPDLDGITKWIPGLSEYLMKQVNVDFWKNVAETEATMAMSSVADIKEPLEKALNGQGALVFPGGGTFEFKDPIFNKAGDLMIGLVFKQGNSATE